MIKLELHKNFIHMKIYTFSIVLYCMERWKLSINGLTFSWTFLRLKYNKTNITATKISINTVNRECVTFGSEMHPIASTFTLPKDFPAFTSGFPCQHLILYKTIKYLKDMAKCTSYHIHHLSNIAANVFFKSAND